MFIPDPPTTNGTTSTKYARKPAAALMCTDFNTDQCGEKTGKVVDESPAGVRGGPGSEDTVSPTVIPNQVSAHNLRVLKH